MTEKDAEDIRRLAAEGLTIGQIGNAINADHRRVREWADRIGVRIRRKMVAESTPRPWSAEEEAILSRRYPDEPTSVIARDLYRSVKSCYTRANILGLVKSDAFHRSEHTSRAHGTPGSGYMRMGEWRVYRGALEKKVGPRDWRSAPNAMWFEANGPVPDGFVATFKQGMATLDPSKATIDRVELVTRTELMRRNSLHTRYPPEVTDLIRLNNALRRKINNREKRKTDEQHAE